MTEVLNLGAGDRIREGAVNHDLTPHRPEIAVAWDLNERPWPWDDNAFDLIEARSVLEHLKLSLIEACDECWRILRPGGRLMLLFPVADGPTVHHDPTHRWFWAPEVLDYLDPDTNYGQHYGYYTERKWQIESRGVVNGRNVKAVLRVRK